MMKKKCVKNIIAKTAVTSKLMCGGIVLTVGGAVAAAIIPPLVLEKIVNLLAEKSHVSFSLALLYFGIIALVGILEAARELLLNKFGQRITRNIRHEMCSKLSLLTSDTIAKQEPGAVVSRFTGDVDTVETLFTSGIISMAADLCKVISIMCVIFAKNRGLFVVLLGIIPLLSIFTRFVQKRMLAAQLENRAAMAKVTNHVPETVNSLRTIHTLGKEKYMRKKYDKYIEESYQATEKTNFYDSIYSPVILILNAAVVSAVLLLAATGKPAISSFFGMSVGTAVAVISYISQVFSPLESIGMEIQTIQSAVAGVHRIDEFLQQPERWKTDSKFNFLPESPAIELRNVMFSYVPQKPVLENVSFNVASGEQLTLSGRTGAGKSTIFKLILGLYKPDSGKVMIHGQDTALIPDSAKRRLIGYVEQSFRIVPGTIADQITLFDNDIAKDEIIAAAKTVGLDDVILRMPNGYDTPCSENLLSQGQWQLLSIARAIVCQPEILLLDEITANLDAETELMVLNALQQASSNRTVVSISHRLYEHINGRIMEIG